MLSDSSHSSLVDELRSLNFAAFQQMIQKRLNICLHLMERRRDFNCSKQTCWKRVHLILLLRVVQAFFTLPRPFITMSRIRRFGSRIHTLVLAELFFPFSIGPFLPQFIILRSTSMLHAYLERVGIYSILTITKFINMVTPG